jgi:hypothetical protein
MTLPGENVLRPWWMWPKYDYDYSQSSDWHAKGL